MPQRSDHDYGKRIGVWLLSLALLPIYLVVLFGKYRRLAYVTSDLRPGWSLTRL